MHTLIIEPEAKLDIAKAMKYYDSERAGLGNIFLNDLKDLLLRVGENPRQYQLHRRQTHKTVMPRFPYIVLYRFDQSHAYILGVMDGRRNPRAIARRTGKKSQ